MSEEKIRISGDVEVSGAILWKEPSTASGEEDNAEEIDPILEKKLLRKLDFTLLPLLALIHCLNFIDRTAIGNAKIAGLEKDLGMQGFDFNIALTTFNVFLTVASIPSNIITKRVGSIWIAIQVILFGIVSLGTAFVKTYGQLIGTRILLGLAEAGTLSSLVYLLSWYYRRKEMVIRIGLFLGISPALAGAFGGLLASGLLSIRDFGVVHTWRKIFFAEGIITTSVGILLLFFIPGDPLKSRLLSEDERKLALARLNADQIVKTNGKKEPATVKLVLRSLNIWTIACCVYFILVNISFQGLSIFLPTVVNSIGHFTVVDAQLRTVPPYAVAGVWCMIVIFWSFYINSRAIPIITSLVLNVVGYATALSTKNPQALYAACFFSLAGTEPMACMLLIWGTDNAALDTMRAVTAAAIAGFGTIGTIIAVWTYLPQDAPNFHKGHSLNLAAAALAVALVVLGAIYLRWENAKRDKGERNNRLRDGMSQEEIQNLGYRHPKFRYQI
ncbi:MFS general substrate transporter [Pholiota conissans]|uniref:MFS general substrate transporter n=1 Tax=Pholiota conissans TaxID=109636 RepID=A0A9P6D633_9AGAR|nr:MFS general substrate transporter [Pholiota conissans]